MPDRTLTLQEHVAEFVELVPNTEASDACVARVSFTNEPIAIAGCLYNGFSFVMPEGTGDLAWAFVLPAMKRNHVANWYIIPAHGTMRGFDNFEKWPSTVNCPGIGPAHDVVHMQWLDRSRFAANERYVIWFSSKVRGIDSIPLSLNALEGPSAYTEFQSALTKQLNGFIRNTIRPVTR